MQKNSFLLLLGVSVFLTPFLGVPESWKSVLLFFLGVCIIIIALSYRFAVRMGERTKKEDFFVENEPPAVRPVGDL